MRIAIDADGVLLNYREGYGMAWERAFGKKPPIKHPEGYHATHYWDVPTLDFKEYQHFSRVGFCEEIWETMPALEGAVEACEILQEKGFELHCVTALSPKWQAARAKNLESHGFKFTAVHAVGSDADGNPKLKKLTELKPDAFVDDYLGYMQGVPDNVWKALIDVHHHNSPNRVGSWVTLPNSRHDSLLDFAKFWA